MSMFRFPHGRAGAAIPAAIRAFPRLCAAELRREFRRACAYWLELLADQILFTLGFLLLSGLFDLVAGGGYDGPARLAALLGFVTWRVADGCILRIVDMMDEEARAGVLEQLWLAAAPPGLLLLARSGVILLYNGARGLLLLLVLAPLAGVALPPGAGPLLPILAAALPVFLLAQVGAFGLTFLLAGLHLVTKNVSAIAFALSTALLFLSGALASLAHAPRLELLGRLLPLSAAITLLRELFAGAFPPALLWRQPGFGELLLNAAAYLSLGALALHFGQRRARRDGSLAHY